MSKTSEAMEWLKEVVGDGMMASVKEIYAQAEEDGISERTLRRAKKKLGVKSRRVDREHFWYTEDKVSENERRLRTYAKSLEKQVRFWDVVGEKFTAAVKQLPPIPVVPRGKSPRDAAKPEVIIHPISDVQVGQRTTLEETGGLGEYGSEVLLKQVQFYKDSVGDIFSKYHTNRKEGWVFFLGDLVDGSTIYMGQQRAIDMPAVRQVIFAAELFANILAELSQYYDVLKVAAVVGNHGRIGKKGECHPLDNLDWLVYKFMEERLAEHDNIEFHIADSWFQLVEIDGWRFLLVHGDDVGSSYLGIPFYAARKSEGRYQALLKHLQDETGGFDYMVIGHHHTPAEFGNVIMNGAWPNGSELSFKRLQLGELVGTQKLFAVNEKFGITWRRDIQLLPPAKPKVEVVR